MNKPAVISNRFFDWYPESVDERFNTLITSIFRRLLDLVLGDVENA
jgi:hypothetical protein